jgi:hypothetical protein
VLAELAQGSEGNTKKEGANKYFNPRFTFAQLSSQQSIITFAQKLLPAQNFYITEFHPASSFIYLSSRANL